MQLRRTALLSTVLAATAVTGAAGISQLKTGVVRFAVVSPSGNLVRGAHAVDASQFPGFPGQYRVFFDRDVSRCAFTATIGDTGAGDQVSAIIDVASLDTPNGVFVETSNLSGIPEQRGFHLVVTC